MFYGYLAYFMATWPILWLFGLFYGYLAYFMVNYLLLFFSQHFMINILAFYG